MISFDSGFSAEEKRDFLLQARSALPPGGNNTRTATQLLYAVTRGGDAHVREVERLERIERIRNEHRERSSPADRYLGGRMMFASQFGSFMTHHAPVHRGVSPAILAALPRVLISPSVHEHETDDNNCIICLDQMEPGQTVIILPCFHRYHEKCISSWFSNSKLCPIDKLDIEKLAHDGGDSQVIHRL
jgi:hypothetical protein